MDAHLPELAEEVAEVLLVGRLRRKLAQGQRHRLRIGPEHGGPLLGGRIAAERLAGDLQHQPVPDRLADAGDRGAIGLRVEAMAPFRVAHMQVDHRGAALEAFGRRPGEFVGGQRQRGMVGLGLAPAIGRNRQRNPSALFGQGHRIPPFRHSPWARRLVLTHPLNNSPLLSVMTHILHRAANVEMPVAVSGSGVEIVDAEGRRYLDASGGAAVSCLGHGHPDVLAAMREAARRAGLCAYVLFHHRSRRAPGRPPDRGRPARIEPCLSRERRFGGDRGGAQDGAPVFRRDRPAPAGAT